MASFVKNYNLLLRVAVLSVHPAPYRDPLLSNLQENKHLLIHTFVYYDIDEGHKEWKYHPPVYKYTMGIPFVVMGKAEVHWNIVKSVKKNKFDIVIIPGYSRLTSLAVIIKCILFNIPFGIIADTIVRNNQRNIIKEYFISYIMRSARILWVPGKASKEYFENQGFATDKIIEGAYCLDQKSIVPEQLQISSHRAEFRKKQGIDQDATVFLAVGKFIEERRYANLVNSFITTCKELKTTEKCALILVGDGRIKDELEDKCIENDYNNIHFLGAIPFEQLREIYSASDVFVHPGAEPYSTAMEYAALFGLHIITTRMVGYSADLIELKAQPSLIDIDDIYQLNDALRIALSVTDKSFKTRQRLQHIANQRSITWAASQFENSLIKKIHTND